MNPRDKKGPTERELEEQLLRHAAGFHSALEQLLKLKWSRDESGSRIVTNSEPGSPVPPATPIS